MREAPFGQRYCAQRRHKETAHRGSLAHTSLRRALPFAGCRVHRSGWIRKATMGLFCLLAPVFSLGFTLRASRIQAHDSPEKVNVHQLVKNAVWNKLWSMEHPTHHYEYVDHYVDSGHSQTHLEVETSHGAVGRLIESNGKPLTAKVCQRDRARLARLVSSPQLQKRRFAQQQAILQRREQLFRLLPQALLYSFDGVDRRTGWIRLKYRPNPAFHPRSRVAGILQGIVGTAWVDPSDQQFAKIDGRLANTVTFGWGILAKLYPGGHFILEQTRLPDGTWRLTTLDVKMQGVVLLFKKLSVNIKESDGSFKEVSNDLTIQQAVAMLSRARAPCQEQ